MPTRSKLMAALSAAVLVGTLAVAAQSTPPAHAQGGEVGGSGATYYLNDAWTGSANIVAKFGVRDDRAYVGDWNADGRDTLAVRRGNKYYLTNTAGSPATRTFTFGLSRDTALVGDWNGDGKDTMAVRRGNHYFISNTYGGPSTQNFHYGRAGDQVLVGDWNGDGKDTFAVRRGHTFYFNDELTGGKASKVVAYGRAGDRVYVGDWNGDRIDTPVVRRGNVYHITNRFAPGRAERVVSYGRDTDMTLVGDWNGDRKDTLGVRRSPPVYQTPGGYAKISYTGQPAARGAGFELSTGREGAKVKVIADRFGLARPTQWYDSAMAAKVKEWQRNHGIPQTGVVGKRTWLAMGYSESSWTALDKYVYPLKAKPNMTRQQLINTMIAAARSYEGSRYVWGGSNHPSVGADCVGVVMQALLAVGLNVEPSNTVTHTRPGNTTPREIYASKKFKHVPYSQRQPGDLIFQAHDPRDRSTVRHVQMYLGNGMVMESVHVGGIVRRENITYPASKNMPTVVRPLP